MDVGRKSRQKFKKGKSMKKVVTVLAVGGLLLAGAQQSHAGDREWATAGKVLTGVIAGAVIAKSFEPAPVYTQTTVVTHAPAPVVYQPAPTVVYQSAPVVVQPRVVYVQPAPVVYHPAPVIVHRAPVVHHVHAPVVTHHYSFGYRPRHRVCW
jgi:hypothetical protein